MGNLCKHFFRWGKKLHFPKVRNLLTALPFIATAFTSCSNEDVASNSTEEKLLSFNVQTAAVQSRNVIESTTLPDKSSIGLFFAEDGKTTYDGMDYQNIQATAAGTGTSQTWDLTKDILLSDKSGTLHAYYPYNPDVTSITSIPVQAGETDYMYATPATGLNYNNHETQLTMHHALAGIRLVFNKGNFTGEGKITSISIKSTNIALSALLDAKTGTLSEYKGVGESIQIDKTLKLETNPHFDIIIVPLINVSESPELLVTIDGQEYTTTVDSNIFNQGYMYTYTLTLNNQKMQVEDVTAELWDYKKSGDTEVSLPLNIKITGNTDNIAFSTTVGTDASLKIIAVPVDKGRFVEEVYVEGATTLQQALDEETGVRTITLTDITANEKVIFQGAFYQIFYKGDLDGIKIETIRNGDNSYTIIATPEADNTLINEPYIDCEGIVTSQLDNTTGVYTFYINDITSAVNMTFNGVQAKVEFDEEVLSRTIVAVYDVPDIDNETWLGDNYDNFELMRVDGVIYPVAYSFQFNEIGEHVVEFVMKKEETIIPQYAFGCSDYMKSIVIPNSVTEIGEDAFYCSGVQSIIVPNSVTTIGDGAFSECYNLVEIEIGSGIEEIGSNPFSLSSVEIIKIKRMTAPTIGYVGGMGVPSGVTLIVPTGATGYDTWIKPTGKYNWTLQYSDDLLN